MKNNKKVGKLNSSLKLKRRGFCGIVKTIKDMIRALRKWFALRELYNESKEWGLRKLSADEMALGGRHFIAVEAIIKQIIRKEIHKFSWWLFLTRKNKDKREKELSLYYSSLYSEAKREDLIKSAQSNSLIENGRILNPPERPFICTTDLGDKYISEFWYKVLKAIFFNAYATGIIIAIVVAISGYYIKKTFQDINPAPAVNVYPDITLPEINPVINVYPK
jgi:hypothetical protein